MIENAHVTFQQYSGKFADNKRRLWPDLFESYVLNYPIVKGDMNWNVHIDVIRKYLTH